MYRNWWRKCWSSEFFDKSILQFVGCLQVQICSYKFILLVQQKEEELSGRVIYTFSTEYLSHDEAVLYNHINYGLLCHIDIQRWEVSLSQPKREKVGKMLATYSSI